MNEDRRISRAKVGIEVGNNPAQMDGEGADGLLVGEAVRLTCCRERGELLLRGQSGDRLCLASRQDAK